MKDNFSIQDWRMNLLTEVENEMPIGNREMPLGKEAGVTDEHQAILQSIQDMVMSGDHTILDLIKDKMQAEWGDDINEAPEWEIGKSYQDGIAKKVVKMGKDKVRVTFDTGDTYTYEIAKDNPENWVQVD